MLLLIITMWAPALYFQRCGVCDQRGLRSACAYVQFGQSLCLLLEFSMTVGLLSDRHLEFLSLRGGCAGSAGSAFVRVPHCWKSHATAHMYVHYTIKCDILVACLLWKQVLSLLTSILVCLMKPKETIFHSFNVNYLSMFIIFF